MQLLAMLTMLIDHIGIVFYPDYLYLRWIGRLAMPLYAYALVLGYRHTSSVRRYMARLAGIGLLSQLPYHYAFLGPDEPYEINVVGTLLVCLAVLWAIDRWSARPAAVCFIAAAACILLEAVRFDYGAYLLLLVLIYRYAHGASMMISHLCLEAACFFLQNWEYQYLNLVATVGLVYAPRGLRFLDRMTLPRWLWRSFYPAHLAVLAVLARLL